jgi:signal peptidase II
MTTNQRKWVIFSVLGAIMIALDQWTKILARDILKPLGHGKSHVVIENYFKLRYSENTGVAFGMLQTLPGGRLILTLVAVAAFALVLYYIHKTDPNHVRLQVALGLVGGGAIGNLIDRIAFGRVTDFIVWHVGVHEWPAFNIADAALVVGVALMALDMFRSEKQTGSVAATKDA